MLFVCPLTLSAHVNVLHYSCHRYYEPLSISEKSILESQIIRQCLARSDACSSFLIHSPYKCIYRRYASLFFIVGVSMDENELAILEFIHLLVETLDKYFENVCELDLMFNLEKAHYIVEEMVSCGKIAETNKKNILRPIRLLDNVQQGQT